MKWSWLLIGLILPVLGCTKSEGEQEPKDKRETSITIERTHKEHPIGVAAPQEERIEISGLLLQQNELLMLPDSDDNKYEGGCNLWKTYNSEEYYEIVVYSKYLLVQLLENGSIHNFVVFSRTDEDLLDNYFANEKPIYISFFTEWVIGIYKHYLFTDVGTGPFVRGLRIIDLDTGSLIYEGNWNRKAFQFDDEYHVRVFKYFKEYTPNAENPDNLVDYVLHEYRLDLSTGDQRDLQRSEIFIGN